MVFEAKKAGQTLPGPTPPPTVPETPEPTPEKPAGPVRKYKRKLDSDDEENDEEPEEEGYAEPEGDEAMEMEPDPSDEEFSALPRNFSSKRKRPSSTPPMQPRTKKARVEPGLLSLLDSFFKFLILFSSALCGLNPLGPHCAFCPICLLHHLPDH